MSDTFPSVHAPQRDEGEFAGIEDAIRALLAFCRKHKLLMVSVADLARHRFEVDEHGAFAAIEGVFPVCPRHSLLEGP